MKIKIDSDTGGFMKKDSLSYSWFHIKGTWSVHAFNGDYLSILSAHR